MNETAASGTLFSAVFTALPTPVLIMGADMRIIEANDAAIALSAKDAPVLTRPCGEILHCINERNAIDNCGETEKCPDCILRQAVLSAISGKPVTKLYGTLMRAVEGETAPYHVMVTAAPVQLAKKRAALLIIEDVTELVMLRRIVPICAKCRTSRKDELFWEAVDGYFERFTGDESTIGYCPDCARLAMKERMAENDY